MPDVLQTRADVTTVPNSQSYRAIIIAKSRTVVNVFRRQADDDDQACERAKAMIDGHAVELWDGQRFIEHFPPFNERLPFDSSLAE